MRSLARCPAALGCKGRCQQAPVPLCCPAVASSSSAASAASASAGRSQQAAPLHPTLAPSSAVSRGRAVVAASSLASLEFPCAQVDRAVRFYHLSETNDFKEFASIVTPDVKWRRRGQLQGNHTYSGAEAVHAALVELHGAYQDLTFTVNTYAEEEGRAALFWTAVGTNRVPMFGTAATFKRSTFSGVTIIYLNPDGRIREAIEYRQPTFEEMASHLRRDLKQPQAAAVARLLSRGHATPAGSGGGAPAADGPDSYCQLPDSDEVDPMWRVRAVQAATEWVENWTPGPDLENLIAEDMEEYNIYSWPDFEQDVVGDDALEERRSRSSQDAVVIRDTIADSATNMVAVHWYDFEQQHEHDHSAAGAAAGGVVGAGAPTAAAADKKAAAKAADVPLAALPREQPTLHPEHGSVEVRNGHLRVHLSASSRRSLGSEDEAGGGFAGAGPKLHKFRGVTLFKLDEKCKLSWSVTFRELKATELDTYLVQSAGAAAAAAPAPASAAGHR